MRVLHLAIILIMLFHLSTISANEINFNKIVIQSPVLQNQEFNVAFGVKNDSNNQINYTINIRDNYIDLFSGDYLVNANSTSDFNIFANGVDFGDHQLTVEMFDKLTPSDKDSNTVFVHAYRGANLKAISIDTNVFNAQPSGYVAVDISIANVGDIASTPYENQIMFNGVSTNAFSLPVLQAGAFAEYSTTIQLPNTFQNNEIVLNVDSSNSVLEYDETDNSVNTYVSTVSGADVSVSGSDISTQNVMYTNSAYNVVVNVKNTGVVELTNVKVNSYLNQISNNSLLNSSIIPSIPANSSTSVTFVFAPANRGIAQIMVRADPDNTIIESSENNNDGNKTIEVVNVDYNTTTFGARTLLFNLQSSCIAFFSNSQKMIVEDVDSNGMRIKFLDFDNSVLVRKYFVQDEQVVLAGVTMKVLSYQSGVMRMLLIYAQDVNVEFSSCNYDLEQATQKVFDLEKRMYDCQTELEQQKVETLAAQKDLVLKNTEILTKTDSYMACNKEKTELQVSFENLKNNTYSTLQNEKALLTNQYEERLSDLRLQDSNILAGCSQQKNDAETMAMFALVGFGILLMGIGGFFIYVKTNNQKVG